MASRNLEPQVFPHSETYLCDARDAGLTDIELFPCSHGGLFNVHAPAWGVCE